MKIIESDKKGKSKNRGKGFHGNNRRRDNKNMKGKKDFKKGKKPFKGKRHSGNKRR